MIDRGKPALSNKTMRQEGERVSESSQQSSEMDNCKYQNDEICVVCRFGGKPVLCDGCPSSFHLRCLGLTHVPNGDWFCRVCCCKICRRPRCSDDCARVNLCHQCEGKYHIECLKKEDHVGNETLFCNRDCEKIFSSLHELLRKTNVVVDNLTWTLLKAVKREDESKLSVALDVLHESFNPIVDAFSGKDMIADVVFSRGSTLDRLNFRGFYTVVLERDKKVVSVATIRIFGKRVAEIPFVATRMQYRRQGMGTILMNEIEKMLTYLGVERLVLPSSYSAIDTWTKSFDFVRMKPSDKSQLLDYVFLNFEGTIMCHKILLQQNYV